MGHLSRLAQEARVAAKPNPLGSAIGDHVREYRSNRTARKWRDSNLGHDQAAGGAGGAFDPAAPIDELDMAGGEESQRRGIDSMLDRQQAGGQGRGGGVGAKPD